MSDADIEKRLRVLTAISTLHRSVGANLDLRTVAGILVKEFRNIVACEGCAILLVQGDAIDVLAECGFASLLGGGDLSVNMPAIKHLVETREPILAGDISRSQAASCIPSGCAMKSLICTPILVGGEVRGIVHIDSPRLGAFDENDLSFIELLSSELSLVFERSLAYGHVVDMSNRDGLTGVLNRRRFDQDLRREIESCTSFGSSLSLLMMDIDHFKAFNDRYGHPRGDQALREIAGALGRNLRSSDRLYRYGGEEFAVLLPNSGTEEAVRVAERLRLAVEQTGAGEAAGQERATFTISIGVATLPCDGSDDASLLDAADKALYAAKKGGRNQVCSHDEARQTLSP